MLWSNYHTFGYKYLKKSFFLSLAERSYRGRTSTERSPGDPLHRDQCNSAVRDQKLPTLHDDRGEDGQRQDGHMENPSKRAQHPAPQGRTGIQHHTCKTFSFYLNLCLSILSLDQQLAVLLFMLSKGQQVNARFLNNKAAPLALSKWVVSIHE